jgi:hypothetical protein
MTDSIEREIGGLRADVQNLIRSVDRLVERVDSHDESDNRRFAEIDHSLSQYAGGREVMARWRTTLHHFISIAGGGALGAALARLTGH